MAHVHASASISLDGYIAGPEETGFEHLFDWYGNGDVEVPTAKPEMTLHVSEASARYWTETTGGTAVLVVGRHLFDMTNGWDGTHPMDVPVVVVSHSVPVEWVAAHPDAPFTFAGSVEAAIEQATEVAGDRSVGVNGGAMASQCLELGLLDELGLDLVPVVLGGGTPLLFGLSGAPYLLDGPTIIEGDRVTHLRYRVRKG
jgi:dihydrofolate reductase